MECRHRDYHGRDNLADSSDIPDAARALCGSAHSASMEKHSPRHTTTGSVHSGNSEFCWFLGVFTVGRREHCALLGSSAAVSKDNECSATPIHRRSRIVAPGPRGRGHRVIHQVDAAARKRRGIWKSRKCGEMACTGPALVAALRPRCRRIGYMSVHCGSVCIFARRGWAIARSSKLRNCGPPDAAVYRRPSP